MSTSNLTPLDDDALALVCGGDGDDPHGEEGTAGGSNPFMRDLTCNLAAGVIGDAAATAGLLIAAAIGGPAGVVLAPVLTGTIGYAATNTARDICINSSGGPPAGGMSGVTAP